MMFTNVFATFCIFCTVFCIVARLIRTAGKNDPVFARRRLTSIIIEPKDNKDKLQFQFGQFQSLQV